MAREDFWEVIKDDARKTFEMIGRSTDDTHVVNVVCEMQDHGMSVRCETIPSTKSRLEIASGYGDIGYIEEAGLFTRLIDELEKAKQREIDMVIPRPK